MEKLFTAGMDGMSESQIVVLASNYDPETERGEGLEENSEVNKRLGHAWLSLIPPSPLTSLVLESSSST